MDNEGKGDGEGRQLQLMVITIDNDYNWQRSWRIAMVNDCDCDGATEWSASMSSTTMAWRREEIFFCLPLCVFFNYYYYFLLPPERLQGQLTTWLQAQKHTWVHSLDVNLKTHVQGKQVYVGLHHLVQILYCNQTLCVCVYAPKT
jgi:hypothetical protein